VCKKQEKLKEYAQQQQLSLDEMLYMGDDIPDYVAMQLTAFALLPCRCSTRNKTDQQIHFSVYRWLWVAAGIVIEKVLKLNGHWMWILRLLQHNFIVFNLVLNIQALTSPTNQSMKLVTAFFRLVRWPNLVFIVVYSMFVLLLDCGTSFY